MNECVLVGIFYKKSKNLFLLLMCLEALLTEKKSEESFRGAILFSSAMATVLV
jgi:hypothetical protein